MKAQASLRRLRKIVKDWKMPPRIWKEAADQFAIVFGERFTTSWN